MTDHDHRLNKNLIYCQTREEAINVLVEALTYLGCPMSLGYLNMRWPGGLGGSKAEAAEREREEGTTAA